MNTDTEKNVNEAIDWLQQTGGTIQDFAVEQAPLYCQEVVAWKKMDGAIDCGTGAIFVIGAIILAKVTRPETYNSMFRECLAPILAVLCAAMAVLSFGVGVTSIVKASTAPRMVIVEHLRSLK